MVDNEREVTVRRAVPDLRLWPGDVVRCEADGTFTVRRKLPAVAGIILAQAAIRGDVSEEGER